MKYLFEMDDLNNIEIKYEKEVMNLNKKTYQEYNENIIAVKNICKKNNYVNKLITENNFLFDVLKIIFQKYDLDEKNMVGLRCDVIDDALTFYITNYSGDKILNPVKYAMLLQNMVSVSLYDKIKSLSYCDRETFIYNYKIKYISLFFDYLETGGDVLISVFNYCDSNTINIIYLLKCLFESITLFNASYIYCRSFLNEKAKFSKQDIEKLIDKNITVLHKKDLNELLNFIDENIMDTMDINKELLKNDIDAFMDRTTLKYFLEIEQARILPEQSALNNFKLSLIKEYRRVYIDKNIKKIHSAIKKEEINIIRKIVIDNKLKKCLEVGMAFGTSAISILSCKETTLISIDPFQTVQWGSMGVKLVKSFKYDDRHELIEQKSYTALPLLLEKHENTFDFIFIDGWHTFDYTLLDVFYSALLLKKNGFMIIDDVLHNGVKQCIKYMDTNYTFLKKQQSPHTVAVYQKIKDDTREWNFHVNF